MGQLSTPREAPRQRHFGHTASTQPQHRCTHAVALGWVRMQWHWARYCPELQRMHVVRPGLGAVGVHACRETDMSACMQGGLDTELRERSLRDLIARGLPGYAVGGLAGGEDKESFWRVVAQCAPALPDGKPRYVMGIGYPVDIVVCVALGADMFDSVYPTRTARFGVALVNERGGVMKLKQARFRGAQLPGARTAHAAPCMHALRGALRACMTPSPGLRRRHTMHRCLFWESALCTAWACVRGGAAEVRPRPG
jgi:queuine/archaeosine tRNA-ribosyltransferase